MATAVVLLVFRWDSRRGWAVGDRRCYRGLCHSLCCSWRLWRCWRRLWRRLWRCLFGCCCWRCWSCWFRLGISGGSRRCRFLVFDALEHHDELHVRRVREHVHRDCLHKKRDGRTGGGEGGRYIQYDFIRTPWSSIIDPRLGTEQLCRGVSLGLGFAAAQGRRRLEVAILALLRETELPWLIRHTFVRGEPDYAHI